MNRLKNNIKFGARKDCEDTYVAYQYSLTYYGLKSNIMK